MKWPSYQRQTADQHAISTERCSRCTAVFGHKSFSTRQPMYVYSNIKCPSYNICCSGKAVSNAQSEFFLLLGTQHAMRMPHSYLWPVWLYNIFPHYVTKGMIFE